MGSFLESAGGKFLSMLGLSLWFRHTTSKPEMPCKKDAQMCHMHDCLLKLPANYTL